MTKLPTARDIVLPDTMQKRLADLAPKIREFEVKIPRLKALGMDTRELEDVLELTKTKRDILMKEFSS